MILNEKMAGSCLVVGNPTDISFIIPARKLMFGIRAWAWGAALSHHRLGLGQLPSSYLASILGSTLGWLPGLSVLQKRGRSYKFWEARMFQFIRNSNIAIFSQARCSSQHELSPCCEIGASVGKLFLFML